MRERKFRIYDKPTKKMIYFETGDSLQFFSNRNWILRNDVENIVIISDKHGILMEYIGKKDLQGKEIYEGDICKNKDYDSNSHTYNCRIEVVEWDNNNARWRGWNFNENGMTCEIIGNIYENPDFL